MRVKGAPAFSKSPPPEFQVSRIGLHEDFVERLQCRNGPSWVEGPFSLLIDADLSEITSSMLSTKPGSIHYALYMELTLLATYQTSFRYSRCGNFLIIPSTLF